jgi:large subunit ribosomal protein L30e
VITIAKKKTIVDKNIEDIRKLVETDKMVVGTKETLSLLRQGNLKIVYTTSNTPEGVLSDIESVKGDVDVIGLSIPNTDLGTICKKRHVISVLGVKKDE